MATDPVGVPTTGAGIVRTFPQTDENSEEDLRSRIRSARRQINLFGLTRNYYVSPALTPLITEAASRIPVVVYTMDPFCASRRDRFRLEPVTAQWGDPERYQSLVLDPLSRIPGVSVYTFNFPCAFAVEEIDDVCRVMLYGHGRRGTDSPIWVIAGEDPQHEYFAGQIRWLESLVQAPSEYWTSKEILVRRHLSE